MKQYKWLLTVGLILVGIGLIAYSITNVWDVRSLAVICVGLILSIFSLIKLDLKDVLRDRRLIYGGNMALVIVLVVAILGLLNFFLARHTWRVDTTAGRTFSLSPQTTKLLKNLEGDINVIAFVKDLNKGPVKDLLEEYSHFSKRFKWELIDPDQKPGLAKKYNVKQYGNLVVISGSREEQIFSSSEENLTNAIIKVTREKTKKVAFITGHGELSINSADREGLANAKSAIEEQNYEAVELLLADRDSIPQDISVVIIPGPKNIFFQGELKILTEYMNKGGSALFLLDPPPGTGMEKYMRNWHVEMGNDLVIDASGFGRLLGAGPEIPLVSSYGDHPIVEELTGLMTFFPMTRSVTPIETDDPKVTVTEIAQTGSNSYAIDQNKITGQEEISISPEDQRGPIPIVCVTTIEIDNHKKTRIVTVGDSDFASNAYFTNQANGDFFMNIISWLMADEDLISIRPKDPEMRIVNMNPAQTRTVFWLTVIILPVIAFALGILVYIRRK